ncbi:unnamed protein product, partial [Ectocarpus sp. 4 AP-2014]
DGNRGIVKKIDQPQTEGRYAYVRGGVRTDVLEPKPSVKHEKVSQCIFLGYPKKRLLCSPAFFHSNIDVERSSYRCWTSHTLFAQTLLCSKAPCIPFLCQIGLSQDLSFSNCD